MEIRLRTSVWDFDPSSELLDASEKMNVHPSGWKWISHGSSSTGLSPYKPIAVTLRHPTSTNEAEARKVLSEVISSAGLGYVGVGDWVTEFTNDVAIKTGKDVGKVAESVAREAKETLDAAQEAPKAFGFALGLAVPVIVTLGLAIFFYPEIKAAYRAKSTVSRAA